MLCNTLSLAAYFLIVYLLDSDPELTKYSDLSSEFLAMFLDAAFGVSYADDYNDIGRGKGKGCQFV